MTQNKTVLQNIALFGAGMLIGVAFIVVIPEAAATLIESYSNKITSSEGILPISYFPAHPDAIIIIIVEYKALTEEGIEKVCLIMGASITTGFLLMLFLDQIIIKKTER